MAKGNSRKFYLADNTPRYIHCYDNGGASFDRYFVVFTGRYRHKIGGDQMGIGMSEHPFHPQGFGQHSYTSKSFDFPAYSHLGRKIKFASLPPDCQRLVRTDYVDIWDIKETA